MSKYTSIDNDIAYNTEVSRLNSLTIKAEEKNQAVNNILPNQEFFYRGNDIVKLWEQYLKGIDQRIKFYTNDHNGSIEIIQSIFNNLTQNKEASLILKGDNTLYINKDKKSISLCGEVNYRNDSNEHKANKIGQAIELIKAYNNDHNNEVKITNHLIIFPYHVSELHCDLAPEN